MCENYTAEEYREVLMAIYNMDAEERKNVFGVSALVGDYVKDFPVSELIEKYRVYKNTPRVGEYWKRNGEVAVVWCVDVEGDTIWICYRDGYDVYSIKYFVNRFTKTEYRSKYLDDFLSEMEEVSG